MLKFGGQKIRCWEAERSIAATHGQVRWRPGKSEQPGLGSKKSSSLLGVQGFATFMTAAASHGSIAEAQCALREIELMFWRNGVQLRVQQCFFPLQNGFVLTSKLKLQQQKQKDLEYMSFACVPCSITFKNAVK